MLRNRPIIDRSFPTEKLIPFIHPIRRTGHHRCLLLGFLATYSAFQSSAQISYNSYGEARSSVGYLQLGSGADVTDSKDSGVSAIPTAVSGSSTKLGEGLLSAGQSSASIGAFGNAGGMFVGGTVSAQSGISPFDNTVSRGLANMGHTMVVPDLIFDGLSPTVSTSLNFIFAATGNGHGYPVAGKTAQQYAQTVSSWQSTVKVTFEGVGQDVGTVSYQLTQNGGPSFPPSEEQSLATGMLAGYSAGTSLRKTSTFEVPTGVPLKMTIELTGQAYSGAVDSASADSTMEATLGFPTTPANPGSGSGLFDLPSGYTVHSEAWGLHNNSLTGGAVPEPEEYAAIFGVGLLGFAVWRHRNCGAQSR